MSFIIALVAVLIVGILIANYYPKPKSKSPLAQGEVLIPEVAEPVQEVEVPTTKATKKPTTKKPKTQVTKKQNNG